MLKGERALEIWGDIVDDRDDEYPMNLQRGRWPMDLGGVFPEKMTLCFFFKETNGGWSMFPMSFLNGFS